MLDYPEEVSFRTGAEAAKSFDDIVNIVKDAEVDVLINYAGSKNFVTPLTPALYCA